MAIITIGTVRVTANADFISSYGTNNGLKWAICSVKSRRKVGRLQRQVARCFLVTQEADSVELGTWCWPSVVLSEKRPLTECEGSSINRAAR